jgi:sugar phosphate isomerase/epimerase
MIKGIGINCNDEAIDGRLDRLEREIEQAHSAGFDAYELSLPACNVIKGGRTDDAELGRLASLLQSKPLRYTVHAPCSLRLADRNEIHERVFLSCLDVTHRIGAGVMVYHSAQLALRPADQDTGPLPDADELARSWRVETEALRRMADRAERLGVTIAVENRDPHLWEIAALRRHGKAADQLVTYHQGMRLDLIAEQVQAIGSANVGICLDVGHAFLAAPYWSTDFLTQIRQAAGFVRHIHWHDNFGRLDDRCESLAERLIFGEADNHLPPGWGAIPLAETLAALVQAGYSGWLTIELRPRYFYLMAETAREARRMIGQFARQCQTAPAINRRATEQRPVNGAGTSAPTKPGSPGAA